MRARAAAGVTRAAPGVPPGQGRAPASQRGPVADVPLHMPLPRTESRGRVVNAGPGRRVDEPLSVKMVTLRDFTCGCARNGVAMPSVLELQICQLHPGEYEVRVVKAAAGGGPRATLKLNVERASSAGFIRLAMFAAGASERAVARHLRVSRMSANPERLRRRLGPCRSRCDLREAALRGRRLLHQPQACRRRSRPAALRRPRLRHR
jgi:hypothetical protein